MCGICGIWNPQGADPNLLRQMAETMRHRGPDDEGFYGKGSTGLATRRLSIIDLETGKQPISNEDETVWVILNGEIYNFPALRRDLIERGHRFRTRSDTEVIVHLYEEQGSECVKALRGMFAFAIWDERSRRLLLARDRLGQKPLYYTYANGALAFASEIKALLRVTPTAPRMNARAMHHCISVRSVPEADTLFEGISKLPAGHTLTLQDGRITVEQYWDLQYAPKLQASEDEVAARLRALLLESVACHMVSDVPVGAFLSGGLDSTLVAAMMCTLAERPISTFSVGVREQDFNELPYARMVASRYGTDHHEVVVGPDMVANLPDMLWQMEEPVDPFAFGVYAVAQLASRHTKVVLGGDGGDEMFAGYDRYLGNKLVDYYCLLPRALRRRVVEPLLRRIPDSYGYNNRVQKLRWLMAMSQTSAGERYAQSASFLRFGQAHKQNLYTETLWRELGGVEASTYLLGFFNADNATDPVDKMLYTDIKTRFADHSLVIVDRMTMAHSLEARSPLIDQEVAEFAASIPAHLKLSGRTLKYIQRRVAREFLPEPLLRRRKQGFGFPLAYWFTGELREATTRILFDSRLVAEGYFRPHAIRELFDEHQNGLVDHNYRLWLLLNLELWYRLFIGGESRAELADLLGQSLKAADKGTPSGGNGRRGSERGDRPVVAGR